MTHKLEESNDEIKIGQYAKEYFTSYFQTDISDDVIKNFTDKQWCHDTFGIRYPILKQINVNIPVSEQVNYNNEYRRYYVKPVLEIKSNHYIICQEWYAEFKPKLIDWINNNSSFLVNTHNCVTNESLIEKEDKIKFSRDYNSITISKSLFTDILCSIKKYNNHPFETGNLLMLFSELIVNNSNYERPQHIINNIRKYLEHEKIISLYGESKKGKYIVVNPNKLNDLIKRYSDTIECNSGSIQYKEIIIYSYADEKQIIVNCGDPYDKYAFLHKYCKNKQPGYKFKVHSKEYVIVNEKVF